MLCMKATKKRALRCVTVLVSPLPSGGYPEGGRPGVVSAAGAGVLWKWIFTGKKSVEKKLAPVGATSLCASAVWIRGLARVVSGPGDRHHGSVSVHEHTGCCIRPPRPSPPSRPWPWDRWRAVRATALDSRVIDRREIPILPRPTPPLSHPRKRGPRKRGRSRTTTSTPFQQCKRENRREMTTRASTYT